MSYGPKPWQQLHWDVRAAGNFILGGTGSGLLVVWALMPHLVPEPRWFVLAGLALIGAGLGAVWLEIGRKLRAIHVFFNPQTSWMTREAIVAVVVFALGLAAVLTGSRGIGQTAALAALVFVFCQGRILRASKGVPAWREPAVTAFIVTTGLVEGTGLFLMSTAFTETYSVLLAFFGLVVLARAIAWSRYRARIERLVPRAALAALDPAGRALIQLGTITSLALALASFALPGLASAAAALAGLIALGAGWRVKYVLVTRAAYNQGFALPKLPVRGTR